MRVRISLTVEVDPEAWVREYGCDPKDVRADVRTYVEGSIDGSPAPIRVT